MDGNPLLRKTYSFALRAARVCRHIMVSKREYVMSRQLLRSATSIGANAEEAVGGPSERDFAAKLSIAYKEARESHYWIRLLRDLDSLDAQTAASLLSDCTELQRIIGSILRTIKQKHR